MSQGYIRIYRSMWDNPLWSQKPFSKGHAWVDLLMMANHKDSAFFKRGQKIEVKRGQLGRGKKGLAERWGWSTKKVENFLKTLKKENQIDYTTDNVTTLITIINYNKFQPQADEGKPEENQKKTKRKQTIMLKNNIIKTFATFWEIYPKRNGKRVGKQATQNLFNKINPDLYSDVLGAVKNYSESAVVKGGYAKDPERFLKNDYWKDWIAPPEQEQGKILSITGQEMETL